MKLFFIYGLLLGHLDNYCGLKLQSTRLTKRPEH